MIRSMTGFGHASLETDTFSLSVEVRSLNSKSQDFSIRCPRIFNDKELEIRNLMAKKLERGKASLQIEFQTKGDTKPKLTVNREMVKAYVQDLSSTWKELGGDAHSFEIYRLALSLPDAYVSEGSLEQKPMDEWPIVWQQIEKAIDACNQFRDDEGKVLSAKLSSYINHISSLLEKVKTHDPSRLAHIRQKIKTHLEEVVKDEHFDPNRFEQEMVYFVEKLDIEEEKTRLSTHLAYFMETMQKGEDCGRKLGFISQEIGREINTIGSKANDATIQKLVVEMKEELEKIKEQSLNIL